MYATAGLPMPTEWDFAAVYREHRRRVYNLCAYMLNSREAAEDAAHEVFLRVHRKIETYDPALPFSKWILKVSSNLCVDILRRRGTEKRLFGIDAADVPDRCSGGPSPLGEMLSSEQGESVRRVLGSLPAKFRVPLVLAYYNEFSYDEIAAALSVPRNTVATLLYRGKQQMREKLRKEKRHEVS
jgi:RNA polymerase sigma-70 factor, ECF subfamily